MLVVMSPDATTADLKRVSATFEAEGSAPRTHQRQGHVALSADAHPALAERLAMLPGVAEVQPAISYVLSSRTWHPERSKIRLGDGVIIGGDPGESELAVIAGPCAVESESQLMRTAEAVAASGARLLRGGAFKPRSSPYSFQGLGAEALRLLAKVKQATGLLVVTEAMDEANVEPVAEVADVLQIGSRNMGNVSLLKRAAGCGKPILLKRGMAATIEELLLAAEYILAEGNPDVVLCERGIRGFDPATRNVMDIAAIPLLQAESHLPVVGDPSHGTGRRALVPAMAKAAVAAGADGLLIEVHPDPDHALSDGPQSLTLEGFADLMRELRALRSAMIPA